MTYAAPTPTRITLRTIPANVGESACLVLVDGVPIGRLDRRRQLGRNHVKDFRYSGDDYTGRTRRASLWEASVESAALDDWDARAVTRCITRQKTTRAAAEHLIAAYREAGIAVPAAKTAA
jgi:hypothetical protein